MCQVTVPGDVTLSEDPITVEFEGPDGVAVPVTATLSGTTNVYTASLPVTLTLSSRGDYFCFATYTAIVMGDNAVSPLGSDSHTADVMSETLSVSVYHVVSPPLPSSCWA